MIVRRILLINVFLLLVLGVLSYNLYSGWQEYRQSRPLERIVARVAGQTGGSLDLEENRGLGNERLQNDFYAIAANDLFHPDRRPPDEEVEGAGGSSAAPKFPKDPEMQGVIESEGERKALLTVFEDRSSGSGESRIVGVNDTVQGWTVAEITDTITTLTWNEESEVIDIFSSGSGDGSSSRPPQGSKTAVNIIRIGNRQSAVEATRLETPASGDGNLGASKSATSSRRGASVVGTGRFPSRPSVRPGGQTQENPNR